MQVMPTRMVKAGEIVFREGDDPADGLFYICFGTVEVSRQELNGQRTLAELSEGCVFGEMALINSAPRNATVTAVTDCGFYTMNRQNFQHRVEQLDAVMRGVFRVLILTIRDFLKQYEENASALQAAAEETLYSPVRGAAIGGNAPLDPAQERKLQF